MPTGLSVVRGRVHLLAAIAALYLAACADDRIVFRDREPFNRPPDAALGFLGYYDTTTKLTTCGNCHAGYQGAWSKTKHANAYNVLNSSSAKKPECFTCHTVTGKGNTAAAATAGHDAVKSSAYYDVQCESCHGPGLQHVEGVTQGTLIRPLAKMSMTGTGNCGDCHSGAHQPFAEEWKASAHAEIATTGSSCVRCHDGRVALARFDPEANFQERGVANANQPTTCAVCHNPHGSPNPAQLRLPVTSQDPEQNLCMQCHLNRAEPSVTQSSPHAPQGAVLLGFAGWDPPGFAYDTARIFGSHATEKNPRLCAGCHVNRFTVTDKLTGAFTFQSTGHLMRPIPCLDPEGKPTADKSCAYTVTARSWQGCTASGCHGTAAAAANAFNTVRSRMKFLADQLWTNLDNDGTLDAAPVDGGLLATLKVTRPNQWSTTDNTITPAEGAEFNARLCGEYNQVNADNSKGAHNPFLCEALLIATINYVRSFYGFPAASVSSQNQLDLKLSRQFAGSMHVSSTSPR